MKHLKKPWFVYVRRSYLPASGLGQLIYLVYVIYVFALPVDWYKRGHSLWELLSVVIPLEILAAVFTQYLASKNSNKS